jgi:serine/threonine protein kinase
MTLIGKSIGHYHILEQLGEGGMATVYKAYDTHLERDVAVKVIRLDQFPPASLRDVLLRFEREAKSLARLTHPNIVHISDYGEQDNVPYLVMDYLPGGTLKNRLGRPMQWQDACKLLLPISQALDYAHEQNLIHRDVKPSNILLTKKGQPMLTDFGIAKILDAGAHTLTATGVGIGTPEYMAPEQWTGNTTPQSDIYSLGVVMYEMITGRPPYTADTPAAILLKQVNEPLPRPTQYVPDLPEPVEKVLIKALAKEPANRYLTMDELSKALEGLLISDATRKLSIPPMVAAIDSLDTKGETPVTPDKEAGLETVAVIDGKGAGSETVLNSQPSKPEAGQVRGAKPAIQDGGKSITKKPQRWWRWALAVTGVIGGVWLAIIAINSLSTRSSNPAPTATLPLAATQVDQPSASLPATENPVTKEKWAAIFALDAPANPWSSDSHSYYYVGFYTIPREGQWITKPVPFYVSSDAVLYEGYVLFRNYSIQTGASAGCQAVEDPVFNPAQDARYIFIAETNSPMTYDEALAQFKSASVEIYVDGRLLGHLKRQEIVPSSSVDDWYTYLCKYTK